MISQEYIGAIVIMLISILKVFHIELASDVAQGLVVGVIALWVAFRRHQKGDISLAGIKQY